MSEWQDVSTAPDDERLVWIWPPREGWTRPQLVKADGDHWRWCAKKNLKQTPRYWMPCAPPEPPTTKPLPNPISNPKFNVNENKGL